MMLCSLKTDHVQIKWNIVSRNISEWHSTPNTCTNDTTNQVSNMSSK